MVPPFFLIKVKIKKKTVFLFSLVKITFLKVTYSCFNMEGLPLLDDSTNELQYLPVKMTIHVIILTAIAGIGGLLFG